MGYQDLTSSDRRGRPSQDDEAPRQGSSTEDLRCGASADGSSASSILARTDAALDPPVSASDGDPADLADSDPFEADMGHHEAADSDAGDETFPGPCPGDGDGAIDPIQGGQAEVLGENDDEDLFFTYGAEGWGWPARSAEVPAYESGDADDEDDHGEVYPEVRDEIAKYGQYLRDHEYAISDTEDERFVLHDGAWYRVPDEAADDLGASRSAEGGYVEEEDFGGHETRGLFSSAASSSNSDWDNVVVLRVEHTPTPPQASWRNTRARGASPPPGPDEGRHQVAIHWTPPASTWGSREASSGRASPPSPCAAPETQLPLAAAAQGLPGDDGPGGAWPSERSRVFWIALGILFFALGIGALLGATLGVTGTPPPPNLGGYFPPFSGRPGQTHYGILQVPVNATNEQIRARYRTLVRAHHPDKLRVSAMDSRRAALVAEANRRVHEITTAYQGLSGIKRCHYDYFDLYLTSTLAYGGCKMRWWIEGAKRHAEHGEGEYFEEYSVEEAEDHFHATAPDRVAELLRPVAKRAAEVAVIGRG